MTKLKIFITICALFLGASTSVANDENSGTGTVAETMVSGGYVYVRIEEDNSWVAASPVQVTIGDKIRYAGGAIMKDFHSRTLNRNFESILFVGVLEVVNPVNADIHATMETNDPHAVAKTAAAVAPGPGDIKPLDGGKSIAEIFTNQEQMEGKQVSLRAKVMKFSPDILGKNWITIQDGTGTAPNNKLLATSTEEVAIGDLVTVKGIVRNDVDLGSGYKYTVVLEEASFSN